MKVIITTCFGDCEHNAHFTTQISNYMEANGHEVTDDHPIADAVIIVSCGVDGEREDETLRRVNECIRLYGSSKKLIVTGCLTKINPEVLAKPEVTSVSFQELSKFDEVFAASEGQIPLEEVKAGILDSDLVGVPYPDHYHLSIATGCANRCSYCAIKLAKGFVKSTPIPEVIKELKQAVADGQKEIVLLSDDCGSYGLDIGTDMSELLNAIYEEVKGEYGLNIHYFFPKRFIELFPKIKKEVWKKVYFVNIPMQTGSQRILELMNREYDIDEVLETIDKLRKINPDIYLENHIIYGFPTETREELEQTFRFAKYYDAVLYNLYSPRKGTKASKLDGKLDDEELTHRYKMILNESKKYDNLRFLTAVDHIRRQIELNG